VRLRPATSADVPLIARMHADSWASAYRGILPDAYLDHEVRAERAAYWPDRMKAIEAGAGLVLIAETGESPAVPVGFMCVLEPDEAGSVLVDNLHALPGHKGAGTGTLMLATAQDWARGHGARQLHLSVLEANLPAIRFYESRGWRLTAREDDHMAGIDLKSLTYVFDLG
jgi:GNAT superfamily N-acetyltransferase